MRNIPDDDGGTDGYMEQSAARKRYNHALTNVVVGGAFLLLMSVLGMVWFGRNDSPYYLGCADRHGKELLLTTDKKPKIQYGLIFLEDDVFTVPEPGMTCRIISVHELEAQKAKKALDNPI